MLRTNHCVWVAVLLAACGNAPIIDEIISEVTVVADTTVVTTRGEPVPVRIESVEVLWQSAELENPRDLLATGGRLIVGDPTRLHILTESGEHIHSVGREGAGPGEFGSVTALGHIGQDTIAVHDSWNQRLSYFTLAGEYLGSLRVTPSPPYVNPVQGGRILALSGGVASMWSENIHSDRPTRTALVWHDLSADTLAVFARWDGERWVDFGGRMFAPAQLFGPRVISAIATDARVAVGDGVGYCIAIHSLVDDTLSKVCRNRAPVPVGKGIRDPDLRRIEDASRRRVYEAVVRGQEIGEYLPSFDRLLFDQEGRLWVRTIGPESAGLHPYLSASFPEDQPTHRMWEVFSTTGHLVGTVEIPSEFNPRAIVAGRIYGFLELPTGEIAIGSADMPVAQAGPAARDDGGK